MASNDTMKNRLKRSVRIGVIGVSVANSDQGGIVERGFLMRENSSWTKNCNLLTKLFKYADNIMVFCPSRPGHRKL